MDEYQMLVDLGALGTCLLEEIDPFDTKDGFTVCMDGYTSQGIRVHIVVDNRKHFTYPHIWNNAILFKLEE